ncbi:MAG: hypothetical protein KAR06_01305 [Deltaproteobacteria bacterium]|nr:hypothetical protein [Deltaproteobacteria bacterium]
MAADERIKRLLQARRAIGTLRVLDIESITGTDMKSLTIALRVIDDAIESLNPKPTAPST